MEREKIYGCFTREEGEWQVLITLPRAVAEFYQTESQWEVWVPEDEAGEDLRYTAIELVEEQAAGEMPEEVYTSFCQYLEDEAEWSGDLEEAEFLEGQAAAERVLLEMYMSASVSIS